MSELKRVSREELYAEDIEKNESGKPMLPNLEFEFVDVVVDDDTSTSKIQQDDVSKQDEEFDFPLFSFGTVDIVKTDELDNKRGRQGTKLMKVSLREPSPEVIVNERPRAYYFADYDIAEKKQFSEAAIDADAILKESQLGAFKGWSGYRGIVLDVNAYNNKVELEQLRLRKLSRKRPSKKQRIAKKVGREREEQRKAKDKELKKVIKKQFHKRGGKKNKKKTSNPLANAGATPKHRLKIEK